MFSALPNTLAILLLAAAVPFGAEAQESDSDPTPSPEDAPAGESAPGDERRFDDEVVITATRGERPLDRLPMSATVVTSEQVERAPALQLDDVLRSVVGLNLPLGNSTVGHPASHLLSMRGLSGTRALALVDGVPLNDPFFGYVHWGKVPVENVESVEVVRGGASSLYGSYALGGTVNILTRPIAERRLAASGLYGSDDTLRLNFSGGVPVSDRFALGADLSYTSTDGYILSPSDQRGDIDTPADREAFNAQVRGELSSESGWRGLVRANLFKDDAQFGSEKAVQSRQFLDLAARMQGPTGGTGLLSATVFYQDGQMGTDNTDLVPDAGRDEEYVSNRHETSATDIGGSLQWSRPLAASVPELAVGLDLRHTDGENQAVTFGLSGDETGQLTSTGDQLNAGLFAQVSFLPADGLELLLSARVDHWDNRNGRDVTGEGDVTEHPSRSFTQFNPRVSARYQLTEAAGLRGSVYQAFRAPNLNELYREFASQNLIVLPNSQLEPELLTGGDVGFDLNLPAVRGQLNLFYNEVEDLISRSVVGFVPKLTLMQENLGAIRSRGLELMAGGPIGSRWSWDLGYAYTDAVITEEPRRPDREGNRVPDVPEHAMTAAVNFTGTSGLEVTLRGRYLSEQWLDTANSLHLDSNTVLDAFLSYPFGPSLEAVIIVENLLDEEYIANSRAWNKLGAPRQIFAGIRFLTDAGETP